MIKLVNEAEEILTATDTLQSAQKTQINVINQQLDNKLTILNDMDKDILGNVMCQLFLMSWMSQK